MEQGAHPPGGVRAGHGGVRPGGDAAHRETQARPLPPGRILLQFHKGFLFHPGKKVEVLQKHRGAPVHSPGAHPRLPHALLEHRRGRPDADGRAGGGGGQLLPGRQVHQRSGGVAGLGAADVRGVPHRGRGVGRYPRAVQGQVEHQRDPFHTYDELCGHLLRELLPYKMGAQRLFLPGQAVQRQTAHRVYKPGQEPVFRLPADNHTGGRSHRAGIRVP